MVRNCQWSINVNIVKKKSKFSNKSKIGWDCKNFQGIAKTNSKFSIDVEIVKNCQNYQNCQNSKNCQHEKHCQRHNEPRVYSL